MAIVYVIWNSTPETAGAMPVGRYVDLDNETMLARFHELAARDYPEMALVQSPERFLGVAYVGIHEPEPGVEDDELVPTELFLEPFGRDPFIAG